MVKRVCVTGAGGFIASWLVKLLLSKGYTVHGTVRDPRDGKNAHLKNVDKASGNLQLFKADLLDYNAVAAAIAGCEGVFHAASPVPSTKTPNPEVEVIIPAVTGTLNVLKACSEAKVKRVVMVSSSAAVGMIPNWPKDKVMDEDCWSDNEYCRTIENWYCLSKTLAEKEALAYADKHGLDVVTVCPSMVFGPLLQSTVNLSSLFLVNILKEKDKRRCFLVVEPSTMEAVKESSRKVCVTGAGGFLGSWLVKILLAKSYTAHGTVRDPSDKKNGYLKQLQKASENLQLFKANLLDFDFLAAAIACL